VFEILIQVAFEKIYFIFIRNGLKTEVEKEKTKFDFDDGCPNCPSSSSSIVSKSSESVIKKITRS
jgi:hypothetical protein